MVWGAAMLMLVFIRDLGSSLMFFGAFLAVLYVATARLSFVIVGLAMFVLGAWFFAEHGRVTSRTASTSGSTPSRTPAAPATRSPSRCSPRPTAASSGRGSGSPGPAARDPKCAQDFPNCGAILPAPHTDFIYAVIVNELGLFGGGAVVLIYALITERGFKTAILADDGFSKLLATGLTAILALQAFVIIGGVTG